MLEIRSFDSGSVKIDYFLNDNSLKLKSIIDINYMNNNVLKNVKLDITIDIKIDKNEPFKDDFEYKIYDENLNLIEESNIYNLPGGIYIFYINNTNGAFIELVKQS